MVQVDVGKIRVVDMIVVDMIAGVTIETIVDRVDETIGWTSKDTQMTFLFAFVPTISE